jgi:hypothetical protein
VVYFIFLHMGIFISDAKDSIRINWKTTFEHRAYENNICVILNEDSQYPINSENINIHINRHLLSIKVQEILP